jgi:Zn-dependent M28 family amino/carboxypeptidase
LPLSEKATYPERHCFIPSGVSATPSAVHYYRSDHFSLARVGIPAFSVDQGDLFEGHTAEWGRARPPDYVARHYHQPSDEYRPDWDFRGNAKLASAQPKTVEWLPGDEFEAARKTSRDLQTQ